MQEKYRISIAESISPRLGYRSSVAELFKSIEHIPHKGVEIDFKGTQYISRSFAHEYLKQKNLTQKEIKEKNIPQSIAKMFQIVTDSKEKYRIERKIQKTIILS
ncbi:MAG: hypothetical protein QMD61_03925 [Methanobacterium sp.]|nr:hypothetical protein [Methanobacterium sp.]